MSTAATATQRVRYSGRTPGVTLAELSARAVVDLTAERVEFPGAAVPERSYRVDADGVGIAVHEWGGETNPAIVLAHGGFDFSRTYDVLAGLLAAGGWRVVAWDQRQHGDSDHAPLSSWAADVRDAAAVLDRITAKPLPIVGHSKGGNLALRLAEAWPHRFSHLVNIDGMPSRHSRPDISDTERSRMLGKDLAAWLDHRHAAATAQRKPGTLDELARRRARMNPRLTFEWLCHLVSVGARRDPDGWRWKIDPKMRMGGFGPWRPEWAMDGLPGLPMPFLGLLGTEPEEMSWFTLPSDLEPWLPVGGRLEVFEGAGHFIHIEKPGEVAALILEFLS